MGLDMYLHRRTYVKQWSHQEEDDKFKITITKGGNPYLLINPEKISHIIEEVAYWRKSNHIHKWFVDNVQGGKDDCGDYYVSEDDLKKLVDLCKQVLNERDKATELLPTQGGFFFGGTDIDEYYFGDLEETVSMIEPCLSKDARGDLYYSSSW